MVLCNTLLLPFQVHNALDAEATCVAVKLNFKIFKLQVVDNGVGITKEHLEAIGTRLVSITNYANNARISYVFIWVALGNQNGGI